MRPPVKQLLLAAFLLAVALPSSAQRRACTANYNASTGVIEIEAAQASTTRYRGDLFGRNNLRMAKSVDNGVTFAFVKSNVLGDDDAYLRRGAGGDSAGFNYWVDRLASASRDSVRSAFAASPEFQARVSAVVAAGCLQ